MAHSAVEQEIRGLIAQHGRITFARFMQLCLYSPRGGFYAARQERISRHFGTSAMTHPLFGALLARQLEQMWRLLDEPAVFHVIEVGSGDGALARSVVQACRRHMPRFARALCYVASDYAPRWLHRSHHAEGWEEAARESIDAGATDEASSDIRRVQADGLNAFRRVVGCILSNELLDNFPVHRFAVENGRVKEIFIALAEGKLSEAPGEPSTSVLEQRLADLGVSLTEGYRGEINLALEEWTAQIARALDRGFVLTIDYGGSAAELYAPENRDGTLVCYRRHVATGDPLENIGEQDITCHVDFTSLQRLGEARGLTTLGFSRQSEFLTNLGFAELVDALETRGLSSARAALNRVAMMALVDPEQYGDLRVLAQAKGVDPDIPLTGFGTRSDAG